MGGREQTIAAVAGAPFAAGSRRQRPRGPIAPATVGGGAGPFPQEKLPTPSWGGEVVAADWDACWLGDTAISSLADWQQVIAGGRLAQVEGSFAIAWRDAAGATHLARHCSPTTRNASLDAVIKSVAAGLRLGLVSLRLRW